MIVEVLDPSARIDKGEALIDECATFAAPTVNATEASSVNAARSSVPVIVALSTVVGEVKVALYVPFVLSVTLPNVPAVVWRTTVPPLAARLFVFASFNCTVIVDVLEPFAAIDVGDAVIVEVVRLAAPAVPVAVNVTGEPVRLPDVAVNVFEPTVVPKVQLPTVAIPLASVVAVNSVPEPPPVATANVTLTPATTLLFASFTMTLGAVETADPAVAD